MENQSLRSAVFAGSFDPFTLGHLDVVQKASLLFDQVIVLVAENAAKQSLFSVEVRVQLIKKALDSYSNVQVDSFSGLTVEYLKKRHCRYLVRGIRNGADLEWERSVAWNNRQLYPECETVFFPGDLEHLAISSSVVRELLKYGGDVASLVPLGIHDLLLKEWSQIRCSV
jgi:pantetheine-phosphate adenylyltransferase